MAIAMALTCQRKFQTVKGQAMFQITLHYGGLSTAHISADSNSIAKVFLRNKTFQFFTTETWNETIESGKHFICIQGTR